MLKISRLADYSIVLSSHMACQPESYLSARTLALASFLPVPTVSKILKILTDSSLVNSKKGVAGGYRLSKPAEEISLLAVVEAVDGPLALTNCNQTAVNCGYAQHCQLQHSWQIINQIVARVLGQLSIVDMFDRLQQKPISIESKLTAVIDQFANKERIYHE